MAFLCPSRVGNNVKTKKKRDKPFSLPVRITGSDSVDTLVRVGLEKQHGLPPESCVTILQDFNPGTDGEITIRKGEEANLLYTENEWAYIIKRNGKEGFVPITYCSRNSNVNSIFSKTSDTFERTHQDNSASNSRYLNRHQVGLINNQKPLPCHEEPMLSYQDSFDDFLNSNQSPLIDHQHDFPSDTFDSASFFSEGWSEDSERLPMQAVFTSDRCNRALQTICDNQNVRQPVHNNNNIRQSEHRNASTSQPVHGNQDIRPFRKTFHGQFIVLFDFFALDENDISVERAELVDVLNIEDQDWSWLRKYDGQEGFVPKSYICPVEPLKAQEKEVISNKRGRDRSHNNSPFMLSTPTQSRNSPINTGFGDKFSLNNQLLNNQETQQTFSLNRSTVFNIGNTNAISNNSNCLTQLSRAEKKENIKPHNMPQNTDLHTNVKCDDSLPVSVVMSQVYTHGNAYKHQDFQQTNSSDRQYHGTQNPDENITSSTRNMAMEVALASENTDLTLNAQTTDLSTIHQNEYTLMPQLNPDCPSVVNVTKLINKNQNEAMMNSQLSKNAKNNNGTNAHSIMVKDAKALFEGTAIPKNIGPKVPPRLPPRTFLSNKSPLICHQNSSDDQPPELPPKSTKGTVQKSAKYFRSCDKDTIVDEAIEEFVTMHDYMAQSKDDLTVTRGELVYSNTTSLGSNKNWVWVYSVKSKSYGYVPRSYIKTPLQTAL